MTLNFPNASRSFDASRNQICFWGYDKTIEISCYMGVDALQRIDKEVSLVETDLLRSFDAGLEQIHKVASKIYSSGKSRYGRYKISMTADDF